MGESFGHVDEALIKSVQNILGGEPVEGTFSLASLYPVSEKDAEVTEENITRENESNQPKNPDVQSESRIEDPSGEIPYMSPLNHLEFFARRHLEHILSVCAIPIDSTYESFEEFKVLGKLAFQPIALTCGDMAFHRVNTSASFFAFEFLIETARRLQKLSISNNKQARSLLDRIQRVCIGHLLWLKSIAMRKQPFAANYWVSGDEMIAPQDTKSRQRKDSPTDSAYQWIKIQKCFDTFQDVLGPYEKAILKVFEPATAAWRNQLKFLDVRADCAWPHAQEDGTNIFRLDDHIWIWKGLKAIEYIEDSRAVKNIEDSQQNTKDENTKDENTKDENFKHKIEAWRNKLREREKKQEAHHSSNVQKKVVRHFTTTNEFLAKRTLAVMRSSQETRFLFHSRDTVLLYACEWNFISAGDSNATEVWQNALMAQPEHEENQEFTWESALHYGLAILMALRDFSIDKRPCSEIIKDSLAILTQSSSPNGLFPGILDKTTKKDDMFHRGADRDFYFHAGFEIPFILFMNAHKIIKSMKHKPEPSPESNVVEQEGQGKTIDHIAQFISNHTLNGSIESNITHLPDDIRTQIQRSRIRTSTMKKSMAINLSIDAENVVDVGDEWLYNYPGFLASKQANEQTAALSFGEAVQSLRDRRDRKRRDHSVWCETTEEMEWLDRILKKSREITDPNRNSTPKTAAVFDIAKKSRTEKDGATKDNIPMLHVEGLWTKLCNPRTVEASKKRFVWLNSNEEDIALCCYLGSHDDEKPAISSFFDRNAKAEHFFHDETTMFLNTWETELHLSFYQLFTSDDPTWSGQAKLRGIGFTFPKMGRHTIAKASKGFRFSGDFFDRFWTCHLIELTSKKHPERDLCLWLKDPSGQHRNSKHKAWEQRKVLELHLFERILITLVDETKHLFRALKKAVNLEGYGKDVFFLDNKDLNYFESSKDWEDLQQSLKHIIDELERVNSTIVEWTTREIDRGAERPRWTWSDETKYRNDINKLKVSTNHKVQEFRSLHLEIKSFREWLRSYQEQIREEISFRNAENIKFFTYVTVVFLPLGFASSIFSMSGVPEQDLIGKMATMAIVALLITVLAILSAPVVKLGFNHALENSFRRWKNNSILFNLNPRSVQTQNATKSDTDNTSKEAIQSPIIKQEAFADESAPSPSSSSGKTVVAGSTKADRQQFSQRRRSASNMTIWLWYILTELPAQIVMSAYTRMINECISMTTVFNVFIGIIVLPWCLVALVARVIAVNLADLIHIISSLVFDTFEKIFNSTERSRGPLEFLLEPSDKLRFFKAARDKGSKEAKREAD